MEAHPYVSVLAALAVLLWPVFFYLWLKFYAEKHFGPFDDK
jgi:predicted membrane protein